MKTLYYKIRAVGVTLLLRLLPRNMPIVYSGAGSSLTLCRLAKSLGYSRVLLVTDRFLAESGLLEELTAELAAAQIEYTVFDGVQPDPAFEQVQAGEARLKEAGCEAVFAVGGGSVLDAAKMIAILHRNLGDLKFFDGIQKAKRPGLPVFAVPTTAGTGSETTPVSVITDSASHRKIAVADGKLVPHYVALDPNLMKTMPPHITASTGMDALTHAVESWLSKASTPASRELAGTATRLIFEYLPRAFENGEDIEAREAMALAAFYAGIAFGRTSVGYAHAIAHQLGRVCGTPHGDANAMVLPEVLTAYGPCVHELLAELADSAGIGKTGADAAARAGQLIDHVTQLRAGLGMSLKPRGLKKEDLPAIVRAARAEAGDLYPVQRYLSGSELTRILDNMLPAA